MEYIYAALLLHKAKKEITEAALDATLHAAGVAVDHGKVKATVAALKGVDIDKAIKDASVVSAAPAAAAPAKAAEKKPAEEEHKVSEEEAAAGLGALFG
ncbi:MAG: 50S ribosomal protein P1 [archaeon]